MTSEELYTPSSDFLQMVVADEITFEGAFGEENLARLIALTKDESRSNRDWAAMLLSQMELDRPEVISALREAADDLAIEVRAEAILGLCALDPAIAVQLVRRELRQDTVPTQIFEAAEKLADPTLVDDLEDFQEPGVSELIDSIARNALAACRAAQERNNPE